MSCGTPYVIRREFDQLDPARRGLRPISTRVLLDEPREQSYIHTCVHYVAIASTRLAGRELWGARKSDSKRSNGMRRSVGPTSGNMGSTPGCGWHLLAPLSENSLG